MDPQIPRSPAPDARRMAAAEARLLAGLSRVANTDPTEPLRGEPAQGGDATQTPWRGPQARWEAEAAEEPMGRRYAFGEVFARGGIGAVRRAEDRKLGRTVAVKELLRFDEAAVQRFAREAEITARLQHPGIVPLYDVGRDASGQPFLCMKLVEGDTLEAAIAGCDGLAARLRLLPHLIAASDAIAYAHRHAVIHRDLKPGNILVGEFGETVVIDWGLAKDLSLGTVSEAPAGATGVSSDLTEAGSLMGTLRYMPPEQARGLGVDARSDVYALGASLLHLITGKPPFAALHRGELLQAVLDGAPQGMMKGVPRALVAIVVKAMRRAPEDRYASVEAFAEDLRRFAAGRVVGAHDYSLVEIGRLWLQRQRTPAMVAAASIVALTVLGGVAVGRVAVARQQAEAGQAAAVEAEALAEQRAAAAETARALADRRSDELRLLQAESVIGSDPTAAIGWLAQLGPDPAWTGVARTIALGAQVGGVAGRTLRGPGSTVQLAHTLADGTIVATEEAGPVWRWTPGAAQGERIADAGELVVAGNGRHFAVVDGGTIRLWRAGEAVRTVTTGEPWFRFAHMPGDATELRGRSADHSLRVDLGDGKVTRLGVDEGPAALAGLFLLGSADGRRWAAVQGQRTLVLWERGAATLQRHELPEPAASWPTFSEDGEVVLVMIGTRTMEALGSSDMVFRERALLLRRGQAPRVVEAHAAVMIGERVVFARNEVGATRVWAEDLRTGATQWVHRGAGGRTDWPGTLRASADGALVQYLEDPSILLATANGAHLPAPAKERTWLGDGQTLLVRRDREVRAIDLAGAPWQVLAPSIAGEGRPVALAAGGQFAARQVSDGEIERIEIGSGASTRMPAGCGAWTGDRQVGLEVADDGRVALTNYQRACLWDAAGARELGLPRLTLAMSFAATGLRFAGYDTKELLEWDGQGATTRAFGEVAPTAAILAIDGGRSLVALQADGEVRVLGEGEPRTLLPAGDTRAKHNGALAVAPDGRTLAVYSRTRSEVTIADRERGVLERLTGAPAEGARDLSPRLRFDGSGQAVALLEGDRVTRWSRAQPGAPTGVAVTGAIDVVFAADGERLVALTRDAGALLVDPAGQRVVPLRAGLSEGTGAALGRGPRGGVLLMTGAGELLRWQDSLPAGEGLRGWLAGVAGGEARNGE